MRGQFLVAGLLLAGQSTAWFCSSLQAAAPNPCAVSHKGVYYANNFSYLNDPCYQGSCLGDCLKLMPVAGGDWGIVDFGGQLRMRCHSEIGMGREGSASTDVAM